MLQVTHKSRKRHRVSVDAAGLAAALRLRDGVPSRISVWKAFGEITPSNLRHTFATLSLEFGQLVTIAEGGIDPVAVQRALGHAVGSAMLKDRYSKVQVPPMNWLSLNLRHDDDPSLRPEVRKAALSDTMGHSMVAALVMVSVLLVEPSFADEDAAARAKAAARWAQANGAVRLPKLDYREGKEPRCFKVKAPTPAQCSRSVWLCPQVTGHGSCSGSSTTEWSASFVESTDSPTEREIGEAFPADGKPALLSYESGDDLTFQCESRGGLSFSGDISGAERARKRAEWEREREAERLRCEKRMEAQLQRARTVIKCELLTVNPCRREAFVRCSGRNVDRVENPALPVLNRVFRYEWSEAK